MSFKDIVVYLDASEDSVPRMRTAVALAARHEARLIGVDISTKAVYEGPYRDAALAIEKNFVLAAESGGLKFAFHAAAPDARRPEQLFSHCADLVITTQPHPDRAHLSNPAVPKDILLTAGVPMLVLPTGWKEEEPIGNRVVVAYNFSREATRTVHDSLPILKAAEKVFIFAFSQHYRDDDVYIQELKLHLERHGVNVALDGWPDQGDTDVTSALFSGLDQEEADLIVCGAYGHSPVFEDIFGGVTHDLLNTISMPVFMSH